MALESLVVNSTSLYLSLFCCIICTLIILFKFFSRTKSSKYNLPPSPPKFPIIGNLHQLGSLPHQSFRALSRNYGPLMFLQLGQTPTLVVSSADILKDFVKFHDVIFSDRPQNTVSRIFYGCKDIAFSPHGVEWGQKRKISVLELLSQKRVRSYRFIREEEVSCLINKIHEACERGCSVNLTQMLVVTSNNIVSRCAIGYNYENESTLNGKTNFGEIGRRVMKQLEEISFGDFFPSLWWLDFVTGLIPRVKKNFRELDAFLDKVIQERKTELRSRNKDDVHEKNFIDILLQLQKYDMLDFKLTQDSIKAMLANMFVGGSDTSATAMEWGMTELIRHPDKMKKLQQEVRGIVGCKSRIDEEDLNEMKYLKCVVKETLRLHPPTPLVPRETTCSVKLRGYDIPARTLVFVNIGAIQTDPKIWERAEEFIPERFENSEIDFKGQDFEFIPFGFGRRVCPGISFGVASVEFVFANLLCWFDWKLPADGATSAKSLDIAEEHGLTVSKKVPLHLQPSPHSFA